MAGTFRRIEKKTSLSFEQAAEIRALIAPRMDPDPYNRDGPYMVSSLHFDGEDDHVIRASSVDHPPFKEKLRLRSYGVPDSDSPVFLEIKRKLCGVGSKRRVRLPLREAEAYLREGVRPPGLPYEDGQILREIDYYLSRERVRPRTYVSYRRLAYSGREDPDFRVTFDSDIVSRRYDLDLRLGPYGTSLLLPDRLIMEVKFTGAVPLWFARLMGGQGLTFHTFSKAGADFKLETYGRRAAARPDEAPFLRLLR